MEKIDRILEAYREGTFNIRLDLYLEYRDLRAEFECIEREEHSIKSVPLCEPVTSPDFGWVSFSRTLWNLFSFHCRYK